jgi:hypothetical protein
LRAKPKVQKVSCFTNGALKEYKKPVVEIEKQD